ncbi:twin transmembrane helix small protein [Parvibium lacunae]|uniref:Twin transmembrane helix small protein n=1 Tax=Parvibium lacunae TaxID=1888893 RepID=A0A368KZX0_9BURK|nr:twin transmembrane helix small protein [Parvibium lacunae]RCS56848.1 twin transmembrane helix small protein [Parvibium lacunae]
MKYIVLAGFLLIIGSLGSALFYMLRHQRSGSDPKKMARALGFRVAFSISLLLLILVLHYLGYVQPTGLR